jgi:hypothetical protein
MHGNNALLWGTTMNNEKDKAKAKVVYDKGKGGILVTIEKGDYEKTFFYPEKIPPAKIVYDSTGDADLQLDTEEKSGFIHTVEVAKLYFSEFSASFNLKDGASITIKRKPKKIIETIKEE